MGRTEEDKKGRSKNKGELDKVQVHKDVGKRPAVRRNGECEVRRPNVAEETDREHNQFFQELGCEEKATEGGRWKLKDFTFLSTQLQSCYSPAQGLRLPRCVI